MKNSYKLDEITIGKAYELYEKGFKLELTKNLIDEPIFVLQREED